MGSQVGGRFLGGDCHRPKWRGHQAAGDPAGSLGAKSGSKEQPAPPGPGAELGEGGGRREELRCQCQPKQKKHLWNNLPPAHRN